MKKMFAHLQAAEAFIPAALVPVGARNLAEGNALPALLGTLGCAGLATLGLRRAYRSTVRFYQGETGGNAAVKMNSSGAAKKIRAPRAAGQMIFSNAPSRSCQNSPPRSHWPRFNRSSAHRK